MENETRYFTIKEKDFDDNYIKVLSYCQMVKGYFLSEEIQDLLGSIKQSEYENTNSTITGFYCCLDLFTQNIETLLHNLTDNMKVLQNSKN